MSATNLTTIERQRELAKLARVLATEPDALAKLSSLDAESLRVVREALSASLFDAGRPTLKRVASASKLLPNNTVARVGEEVFGPLLCARIVGLLPPQRALDLSLRMPDEFLADTSAQLDPREARQLVSALPKDRVVAVACILEQRRDFITLARFVDFISCETIEAVIAAIPDELSLFEIATLVDSHARVAELLALVPRPRLRAMVHAIGVRGGDVWLDALRLMGILDDDWKRALGDLAAELETSMLEDMLRLVCRTEAYSLLAPLVLAMSEGSQRRFLEIAWRLHESPGERS